MQWVFGVNFSRKPCLQILKPPNFRTSIRNLNGRIGVHSSAAQQRNLVLLSSVGLQAGPIENGGVTSCMFGHVELFLVNL